MQTFVRMSKLSDIVGRSDYISNPERQEHIVLARSYSADWKAYQEFERSHQKSSKANNEGRELIIALPNEWAQLSEIELASRMNDLAQQILPNKGAYQWAVHWNKSHTNLHVHLIFSERNRQYSSSGVWDRDIYLTQDGKIARRKADRAVDRNGKVKPPVHRKGDPKDDGKPKFTPKDAKFKSKAWLEQTKALVADFYRKHGIQITEQGVLHQHHEGKGKDSAAIHVKNERIRHINDALRMYQQFGFVFPQPHTLAHRDMVIALRTRLKDTGMLNLVRSFAVKAPATSVLTFRPEIEQQLREKIHAAGLIVIRVKEPKAQKLSAITKIEDVSTLQRFIDDLERDFLAANAPAPAPADQRKAANPVDSARIIALRDEYFRKACVLGFLDTARFGGSAQQAYLDAQQYVKDFDAAAKQYHDLNDQLKATINPFKRHKLRVMLDEAAELLGHRASRLASHLGINMLCNGREFDSFTATRDETDMISRRTQFPLGQKRSAAEGERKRNAMIQQLADEKVTAESVRDALGAFERACKAVPEEQRQGVYTALCASPTPSHYEFEQSGYISASRRTAKETVSRIVSALKPTAPPSQHEKQLAQTQDVVQHPPRNIGFHR